MPPQNYHVRVIFVPVNRMNQSQPNLSSRACITVSARTIPRDGTHEAAEHNVKERLAVQLHLRDPSHLNLANFYRRLTFDSRECATVNKHLVPQEFCDGVKVRRL